MRLEHITAATVQPEQSVFRCAEAVAQAQRLLQQATEGRLDAAIQPVLSLIGTAWHADRAYVFSMRDMVFISNTHEWCADGIAPMQNDLQQIPYNVGEAFWSAFREHGALHLHSVEAMPVGSELRQVLIAQEIKSLIAVPLLDGPEIVGFFGLDFCKATRPLDPLDIPLLKSVAATLSQSLVIDALSKDRARQKADLRIAQERIAAMIHARQELLIELDRTGTVTGFHQSPHMTFALSPVEIVGQLPEAFLPPHLARICRHAMAQADRDGWSESFDYPLLIDGKEKRFSLHVVARDAGTSARSKGYLFVMRDITDSYLPDHQDRLLARIAELSSNMIILTDAQRRISWVNPASIERTGYTLREATGQHPADLLRLAENTPAALTLFDSRMATGATLDAEFQALNKVGIPFWVKLSMRLLANEDGTLQGFMIIGNDVTMQKLAETRALRDRATAMDALSEGIALIERDGRCVYLNPALRALLDLPPDTPSTSLYWHEISPAPFNRQLVELLPQLYAEGAWRGEFIWPRTPERTLYFDISISVQDDGGFLFISRNITARKDAEREQALLREHVQIAQSRQLVAQLASGLAHDVANVLAVISHVTGSLKLQQSEVSTEALARIDAATDQAQALVRNLSRLGRRSARSETLDLRPLMEQAADLLRPSLCTTTQLQVTLPDSPIKVFSETTSIMQVVLNLLLNARDALASSEGHAACISLELSSITASEPQDGLAVGYVRPNRDYARIRVSDTGHGLAPELADVMFNPYVSGKGDSGVGLGLSIVADIIRMAQGAIRIDPAAHDAGAGTCIEVFWPSAATRSEAQGPEGRVAAASCRPLQDARILLVDDDDDVLRVLSSALSEAGAEVASCIDPRDALDALKTIPDDWDIVITDHDMGAMTGTDMAKVIAQFRPDLPIILVTGGIPLQNASNFVHPAITRTLQKPVSAEVLIAITLDLLLRTPSHGTSEAPPHALIDRG